MSEEVFHFAKPERLADGRVVIAILDYEENYVGSIYAASAERLITVCKVFYQVATIIVEGKEIPEDIVVER